MSANATPEANEPTPMRSQPAASILRARIVQAAVNTTVLAAVTATSVTVAVTGGETTGPEALLLAALAAVALGVIAATTVWARREFNRMVAAAVAWHPIANATPPTFTELQTPDWMEDAR